MAIERKIIMSKAVGYKYEKQFFMDIQEAILDGWRLADNDKREDQSLRNFRGRIGKVVLYKEVEEVVSEEPSINIEEKKEDEVVEEATIEIKEESKPKVSRGRKSKTN